MKKILCLVFATGMLHALGLGQLYMTKTGSVIIHSETILETIHAENKQVYAVIDTKNKNIAFSLLVKGIEFDRKLMQEHFNENYAESDKFPRSTFNGSYAEDVPTDKDGTYPVTVKGKLYFHGVARDINVPAKLTVKGGKINGSASFKLNPEDYNISIPFLVREKIAKQTSVEININCDPK